MELETRVHENFIQLPFATTMKLFYKKASNELIESQAKIVQGPAVNHFIAVLDENDVDFYFVIDNSQFPHVLFNLKKSNENYKFLALHHSVSLLEEVPPADTKPGNAIKLHFKQDTSPNINRLEFDISHSLIPTINIHVIFPGVKCTMNFTMRITENVIKLKVLIYYCYRVSPRRQSIYHNGDLLYDIGQVGWIFKEHSSVVLTCRFDDIPLYVQFPAISNTRPYTAQPYNTGRDLQEIVQMESSMSHKGYYFIYNRKIVPMTVPLQECGIGENATIDMVTGPQQISVKCFDEQCAVTKRFTMDLEPINTSDADFRKLVLESEGIADDACFIHLSNLFGNKLPAAGDLRPTQSRMCLVELYNKKRHEANLFPILIFFFNRVTQIYVDNNWNVDYLRSFVEEKLGNNIDLSPYPLILNGQRLTGDQILAEYNLWPGCFITIESNPTEPVQYSVLPTRQEVYDMQEPSIRQQTLTYHSPAAFDRNPKETIKPFIIDLKFSSNDFEFIE